MMDQQTMYDAYAEQINNAISYYFPMLPCAEGRLFEAAHYSLYAGGKRLRPVLLLESARVFGAAVKDALPFACALEMIHTYSLIHDDLPCMDNDSLRRGQPANHIVFGEAAALLTGDALLTEAFEIMLDEENAPGVSPVSRLRAAYAITRAAGISGMAGGQMIDIESVGMGLSLDEVVYMHLRKTGALFIAAVEAAAALAGVSAAGADALRTYARLLAMAFQARDDLLDATGETGEMGKNIGKDESSGRSTLLTLLGERGCAEFADGLSARAKESISVLPENEFLIWLADQLLVRRS